MICKQCRHDFCLKDKPCSKCGCTELVGEVQLAIFVVTKDYVQNQKEVLMAEDLVEDFEKLLLESPDVRKYSIYKQHVTVRKTLAEDYSVESLEKSSAAMLKWLEGQALKAQERDISEVPSTQDVIRDHFFGKKE